MGSGTACGCPKASFNCHGPRAAHPAHGQPRQGQHHCPPCPPRCRSRPPCCGDRFRTCARAATARELSFREKNCRRPHEIWARRSGHFSMPATALHRSESYLSVPWHLSMPRGRALEGPTTRTRVPRPCLLFPRVHFYPSSELRIRKFSRTRAFGPSSDFGPPKSRVFPSKNRLKSVRRRRTLLALLLVDDGPPVHLPPKARGCDGRVSAGYDACETVRR